MAFLKKSGFANYISKGSFFEAFIEYMGNEDACEAELDRMRESNNNAAVEDFLQYANLWNKFRELVLLGEYEQAKNAVMNSEYGNEMGVLEIKSVLNDLADKAADFNCYKAYWYVCGMDTVDEHEYALSMLTDVLSVCPQSKKVALEHLWWLIDNSEKKQKLKYAEKGLQCFLMPNTFVPSSDAVSLMHIARKINPKSKDALKTEYMLFERDRKDIEAIRQAVQDADYEQAFETLRNSEFHDEDHIRRVFLRGAHENKADAVAFVNGLQSLYKLTHKPEDAFTAATAVWHCDLRRDEKALNDSMELALSVLDDLPRRERYAAALLDALYLMEPYPLSDDVAVKLAESVLEVDPEDETALECIAIANEQDDED